MAAYVKKADRMAANAAPQGPAFDPDGDAALLADDAALGIGEEDAAAAPAFAPKGDADAPATVAGLDVAALLSNPDFAKLVDTIVASRMGAQTVPRASVTDNIGSAEWREFMDKLGRQFDAMQEQKPGYIKPWTLAEKTARDQGLADLKAILADYRAKGIWPTYLLGENFYGQSVNGLKTHLAGKKIKTLVFPAESFRPCDEAAVRVFEAYKRWVGEVHPIEDLLATAMMNARGQQPVETTAGAPILAQSDVIELEDEAVDMTPARTLGTLVPEPRVVGKRMASGAPVGPEFIDFAG